MARIEKKTLEAIDVHSLPNVMLVSLWIIEYVSTDSTKSFGSTEIARYAVEKLGIRTSKQAVHTALTKAVKDGLCHKTSTGFSIMKLGQDELISEMNKENVTFIEPGKPFAAGMKVEGIFSNMKGIIKISDPYVDVKTLDVVYRSANVGLPIRILTVQIKDEASLSREIKKLHIEGLDVEVRKLTSGILHDRYLIDDEHLWLSGNSLNNLGKKESFIVMLSKDMRNTVNQTFDSRWQSAVVI